VVFCLLALKSFLPSVCTRRSWCLEGCPKAVLSTSCSHQPSVKADKLGRTGQGWTGLEGAGSREFAACSKGMHRCEDSRKKRKEAGGQGSEQKILPGIEASRLELQVRATTFSLHIDNFKIALFLGAASPSASSPFTLTFSSLSCAAKGIPRLSTAPSLESNFIEYLLHAGCGKSVPICDCLKCHQHGTEAPDKDCCSVLNPTLKH